MSPNEPDFNIVANDLISNEFRRMGITKFQEAATFIQYLKYGRNVDKENLATIFSDKCGTCSTKHAVLKTLAGENAFLHIGLRLGIFKMNAENTPKIAKTLEEARLKYIPEAHNFLRYNGHILDYTSTTSDAGSFEKDLLEETAISPEQIGTFKVNYHKRYLQKWLASEPSVKYSVNEIWSIREQCIKALSQ